MRQRFARLGATTLTDTGTNMGTWIRPRLGMNSIGVLLAAQLFATSACTRNPVDSPAVDVPIRNQSAIEPEPIEAESLEPTAFEATAQQLLDARLPAEQRSDGWIQLFDGHTLFGWEVVGQANWRVKDGKIVVDEGEPCLLCTSVPWQDYELVVEFRAGPETNSGVFLRTPLQPIDPAVDCYEVNIAPSDNPFPTASIVKRTTGNQPPPSDATDAWRTLSMRLLGPQLQVSLDDILICDYDDPSPLPAGRIGLQLNHGPIEFRSVRLRPLGLESLLDAELSHWKQFPDMEGEIKVAGQSQLQVIGGPTQLESNDTYDDFVLLAEYKLSSTEVNSGIFFRCIPGDHLMGYECQINCAILQDNPLLPKDCGSGGIFRRHDARVVADQVGQWSTVVLVAHHDAMATWVNGVQVSHFVDNREPNENPRRGSRREAGSIMIQGHDPQTDIVFRQFNVCRIGP